MKLKNLIPFLLVFLYQPVIAQKFNNIYEDAIALKALTPLKSTNVGQWLPIIQRYVPTSSQSDPNQILAYFQGNLFGLSPGGILPATIPPPATDTTMHLASYVFDFASFSTPSTNNTPATGFSTAAVADALTQLIIERGKEELTATFFDQLKKQLNNNPELQVAFPKTYAFLGQIESYLYASYLTTLREGFFDDVNDLPFNLGPVLRTPRMKAFLVKNQKLNNVWIAVPVLCFAGDLHKGKPLADAIKDLYPDDELKAINIDIYNTLKMTAVLSESVRDKSGKSNWVLPNDFQTKIIDDPATLNIFLGLLYETTKSTGLLTPYNDYITVENKSNITNLIKSITTGFSDTKNAIADINATSKVGTPLTVVQILTLLNNSATDIKAIIDGVNALAPNDIKISINTDVFFETTPKLITIVTNFSNKKYAAGIMNSMLLVNQFIGPKTNELVPLINEAYLNPDAVTKVNLQASLNLTITNLNVYAAQNADDNIKSIMKDLNKSLTQLSTTPTDEQVKEVQKIFKEAQNHTYDFDANELYQKLLKYGSLMAALSEAKTTADVTAALDAAILPVGSSSIKYYTAVSISLNSYIGASYYQTYYNTPTSSSGLYLNTAGVALPIGVNLSFSTRGNLVGALSLFVSVVDLGAIASYRLSNPPNVNSQTLPDFTLQNLLAPGGYIVLGRLFKTPLAIGLGAQRAPQLSSITDAGADISKNQTWRFGAFLSVDIPLFNLYSKSLKRPIN